MKNDIFILIAYIIVLYSMYVGNIKYKLKFYS